jgi:hypothetical protein
MGLMAVYGMMVLYRGRRGIQTPDHDGPAISVGRISCHEDIECKLRMLPLKMQQVDVLCLDFHTITRESSHLESIFVGLWHQQIPPTVINDVSHALP